jgi:hypothetical protein
MCEQTYDLLGLKGMLSVCQYGYGRWYRPGRSILSPHVSHLIGRSTAMSRCPTVTFVLDLLNHATFPALLAALMSARWSPKADGVTPDLAARSRRPFRYPM